VREIVLAHRRQWDSPTTYIGRSGPTGPDRNGTGVAHSDTMSFPPRTLVWLRVAGVAVFFGLALAAWVWTPVAELDPQTLSFWLRPYRHAWYALPLVVAVFVVLGLVLVPVLLLIAATGIVFGPVLGPVYAMAGSLASASAGFAIGRWMGADRVEQLGGGQIARLIHGVRRNGTLAVFLVRKVPVPFTLANVAVGASAIRFRDFIVGTTLGMTAIVVALAGFGSQLTRLLHEPSAASLAAAALFFAVPLTVAVLINRAMRRGRLAA
jgi:phospholipase D1/2